MIRTDSVVKRHGSLVAVDDVSIDIRPGVTAIIGPNGAGKSTLLAAVGRLVGTDGGVITVDGLDVTATKSRALARRLAILRQDNHLAIRLSVEDLVAYGRFPPDSSSRKRPRTSSRSSSSIASSTWARSSGVRPEPPCGKRP